MVINLHIDIIIVNYNSTDYSIQCIGSIYSSFQNIDSNIIVVDNASKDQPARIKRAYPDVDLILNDQNIGFSKAVNIGLRCAESQWVIILNSDTIIFSGFLDYVVPFVNSNQEVAIVGPKILENDGTIQGSARRFPTVLTSLFGRKSPLTKMFPNNPVTKKEFLCFNGNGNKPIEVDWVSGACMIARTKALNDINGFDERFFMYWEDADLCSRLKNAGWKIIYYPLSKVYHHTGKSSNTVPLFSIFHFHRSCYIYFKKHAKWPLSILNPIALMGLSLRCLLVMGLYGFQQLVNKNKRQ